MELISVRELFRNTAAYAGKNVQVGGWVRAHQGQSSLASSSSATVRILIGAGGLPRHHGEFSGNFQDQRGRSPIISGTLVLTPGQAAPLKFRRNTVKLRCFPDYPLQKSATPWSTCGGP